LKKNNNGYITPSGYRSNMINAYVVQIALVAGLRADRSQLAATLSTYLVKLLFHHEHRAPTNNRSRPNMRQRFVPMCNCRRCSHEISTAGWN